ncbi:YbaN family protein [Pyxidicoccus sp. 3LG]
MPSEPPLQPPLIGDNEGRASRFRPAFLALGFVCVGLGGLGVFLPVLPTTPFLLVALWAFSRSSRRFHHWLYTHPRYGPRLQAWQEHGVVPVRVKVSALTAMVASLTVMAFVVRVKWPVLAVTGALMLVGATYVLRRPSRPPRTSVPAASRGRAGPVR